MSSPAPVPPPPAPTRTRPRRPGRPATYVFDKPDHLLTDKERKHKIAIEKRRIRQNRSYHRRKKQRNAHKQLASPTSPQVVPQPRRPVTPPTLIPDFSQNPLDLLSASNPTPSLTASSAASPPPNQTIEAFSSLLSFPTSSSSAFVSRQTPLPPLEAVEQIDATITSSPPSLPSFSFDSSPIERSSASPEEEHDLATDKLVSSALAVAKSYARDTVNLKHAVDQETDLRRMTGIKSIVFDNLRSKYHSMKSTVQSAVRHFVIFPRTFNLRAATAVAGLDEDNLVSMQGMLDTLINANFITTSKGRYEVNEAARLFLNEDPTVFSDNVTNGTYDVAQNRFIHHYRTQLSRLQDDNIHRVGWVREEAMALYDSERENMEFSEYLLNGRNEQLREFLTAGITVMRYCVSAANRERVLRKALMDDETSTEDIFLPIGTDSTASSDTAQPALSTATVKSKSGPCDKNNKARLQLALSEAYFDQLKTEQAEKPLLQALKLMGDLTPNCGTPASAIVDSVLVLLLLSNLRLNKNRIRDARLLCVKALRILADAGLGRSTFGINAMSNLVTIYLSEGWLDKAKSVANKLLDTLQTMRYTGMPIYADALGVCAMVSMAARNYSEAERQYGTALETVGKWGSKDWSGIPVQHCLDLDLWLMEGLAAAIRKQGRIQEAVALEERAAEDRKIRGLPKHMAIPDLLRVRSLDLSNPTQMVNESSPSVLRHLY
ncbi:hypothetical protein FGB62_11g369 [Gracilaria domingensis]|nr:hypothetical protein FGB62_11g369 [Gracilaria domingensis]